MTSDETEGLQLQRDTLWVDADSLVGCGIAGR